MNNLQKYNLIKLALQLDIPESKEEEAGEEAMEEVKEKPKKEMVEEKPKRIAMRTVKSYNNPSKSVKWFNNK
jgi:hypothetical protein